MNAEIGIEAGASRKQPGGFRVRLRLLQIIAAGTAWVTWTVCAVMSVQGATVSPEVEDILTREPLEADYDSEARCIPTRRIRRTEVLDDQHIVLHMGRDQYYVIRFNFGCPGLRPRQAVMLETSMSNRLCALDGIRPIYETGLGGYREGMRCSVPSFQQVTKEQVLLLKDTLKLRKRKPDDAPLPGGASNAPQSSTADAKN